jgi:hypothetical protein
LAGFISRWFFQNEVYIIISEAFNLTMVEHDRILNIKISVFISQIMNSSMQFIGLFSGGQE